MLCIQLKDGTKKEFENAKTGYDVASALSKSLAKEAAAVIVNGEMWDLNRDIPQNASIEIIKKDSTEGLELIRHDCAHIMAQAVKELYQDVQVTIGPSIETGFYYDFYKQEPFTPEDLEKIEKRMHDIVDANLPFIRHVWKREDAIEHFKKQGESFKVELIESIPASQEITFYEQGSFLDLCRGPHLSTTADVGHAFKLMSVAGSYWRGDHTKARLQRIYGTAWANQKQLDAHLTLLEEAQKRDHRKLGTELNLFHIQEEAVGSIFWHPNGWTVYRILENFVRQKLQKTDYVEVKTPQLVDSSLWEASGHWDKFGENMFTVKADEDKTLAVKPMNCPCHVQIFKQGLKSYRDLPLRMAEFGSCHRNEPSGALHGLMRVRSFTQDDAHIFCTPEQIVEETKHFCDLLKDIYAAFGFTDIRVKFSDRPEKRAGTDESWDKAEKALAQASTKAGLDYTLNPGEGAFYGPKLEFVLRDALGRDWQCGTLQVDFILPERLDASYIGEDGKKHRPVMLHRAVLGSFERFIGILIEHYAGRFPTWLAPIQAVVTTITSEANEYGYEVLKALQKEGLRVELDTRNEKISYKIREHSLKKVPFIVSVGKKEAEGQTVSIRRLGSTDQLVLPLKDFVQTLVNEAKSPL
ncbi:MAG TPA: threonine--tRNA ligase [Alphaproteobacteria bacterium]|nr:threonine--tRNA ligase [Alphaproteobacteria bacterium]